MSFCAVIYDSVNFMHQFCEFGLNVVTQTSALCCPVFSIPVGDAAIHVYD